MAEKPWTTNYPTVIDDTISSFPAVNTGDVVLDNHANGLANAVISIQNALGLPDGSTASSAFEAIANLESHVASIRLNDGSGGFTDTPTESDSGGLIILSGGSFTVTLDDDLPNGFQIWVFGLLGDVTSFNPTNGGSTSGSSPTAGNITYKIWKYGEPASSSSWVIQAFNQDASGGASTAPAQLTSVGSTIVQWTGDSGLTDEVSSVVLSGTDKRSVGLAPGTKSFRASTGYTTSDVTLQFTTNNPRTFEAILCVGDANAGGVLMSWGGSGETEPTNFLYQLEFEADGRIRFFSERGAGTDNEYLLDAYIPIGDWFHIALTVDPGSTGPTVDGELKIFLNGILFQTVSTYQASTGGSSGAFYLMTHVGSSHLADTCVQYAAIHGEVMTPATILTRAETALGI